MRRSSGPKSSSSPAPATRQAAVPALRARTARAANLREHVVPARPSRRDRRFSRRCRSSRASTNGSGSPPEPRQAAARPSLRPRHRGHQGLEHPRVELRNAVERGRDIGKQNDRIVVLLVDVDPRERSRRPHGPLASSVVFPSPDRRTERRSEHGVPPRHRSALARYSPDATCGGSSFDSSSSNAGAGRTWSPRLRRAGADFTDSFPAGWADARRRPDTASSREVGRPISPQRLPGAVPTGDQGCDDAIRLRPSIVDVSRTRPRARAAGSMPSGR